MNEVELPRSWRDRAIVIRDVDDLESWFREDELLIARSFKRERRQSEWMLARVAAKELARRRGLIADPRDFTADRPRVSISHSGPYAAAAIDVRPVGIDIEVVREVDERAARHFLTNEDAAELERCTIANRILHFWCAKEAAWKQRGGAIALLRDVPLTFTGQSVDGLQFREVETFATGEVVVALTM